MEYTLINCRPVPASEAGWIQTCLSEAGATLNSALRTQDAVDYARSKGCTLSSQAELYNGWIQHKPGFNPANPPGFSTHELKSDGVAYPNYPRGASIPSWAVGLDIDDAHVAAFCARARAHGWIVTVTYPGSPSEYHHVNARQKPEFDSFVALKKGDHGDRVKTLVDKLAFIHAPGGGDPYLPDPQGDVFNDQVFNAVKDFQRDHHLEVDGVVGKHTWQQIIVSYRQEQQNRQIDDLKVSLAKVEKDLTDLRSARTKAEAAKDQDKVKKLTAQINEDSKKADALRKKIHDLGGNPSTA
jgi:hypothetical protein